MDGSVTEYTDLVERRADVMSAIEDDRLELRTIRDRTGVSRSTVNRAIRSLEAAGLVEHSDGAYTLTTAGRLALEHYRTYRRRWEDLIDARAVLSALPRDAPIDVDAVAGGEASVPPEAAPYRPVQRLQTDIAAADRYRGILPTLPDPRGFRLLYEHVTTDGRPAELVVSEELRSSLVEEFPRRLPAMADTGEFELFVGDVPPFGLVLTESDGETTLTLVAFGESGSVDGVIRNDSEAAVRWAEEQYARVRDAATPDTDGVPRTPDGGRTDRVTTTRPAGAGGPAAAIDLPVALDRQGFVRLNRSFFADRAVADPVTAWRAGLDIAEVHTGYAIERVVEGEDGDREPLADRLTARLLDGEDCALIGPPGSGKSTVCKRVASEWYGADRGPVLYREGGRGAVFDAVEELLAAVEGDDHALVVVEDAVRPDAVAVFEAIERLADREDVSFLLDAREREWRDPPGDPPGIDDAGLRVEYMPRFAPAEYDRLVEHFERTAGVDVDVPIGELREETESAAVSSDGSAPGEILVLLHRLSAYADPLADCPTGLEQDATAVREELDGRGDGALEVAILANALNAAGVAFGPEQLRAVADALGGDTAFEAAIDVLADRVLFGVADDGSYRTIHETWSIAFLETLLEAGEAAARERFGRCLSAFLGLADDPDALERRREGPSSSRLVERLVADPSGWADETTETVFALGLDWPKLAPLFGDATGTSVTPPEACASVGPADCRVWLGEAFLSGGEYGRAARVFESLLGGDRAVRARLGLARAAAKRGEHDRAIEFAEACRGAAGADRRLVARADRLLGEVAYKRGAYDRAREFLERGLAAARELDDRREVAADLTLLGRVAEKRGEYGTATDRLEEVLAIAREIGDRARETVTLNDLGNVLLSRGEYDRAADRLTAAIEIARARGDRHATANALNNLGLVRFRRREYARARETFERALEIQRGLGTRQEVGNTLGNLGVIARKQGDHEQAREYYTEHVALAREVGNRHGEATSLSNIGILDRLAGDYGAACRRHSRALDIHREIDAPEGRSISLIGLGEVAQARGDADRARAYYEWSLRICERIDDRVGIADAHVHLAELAVETGRDDRARDHAALAVETAEAIGDTRMLAWARLAEGRVALRGDPDGDTGSEPATASDRLESARELFEAAGDPHDVARADRWLGRAAAAAGDHERARERWERALETFEALGTLPDAVATLRDLVDAADRQRVDPERIEAWCERAARHLEELPAAHDDDRAWFREHCP